VLTTDGPFTCTLLQAFLDAAICFFVPFMAASPTGSDSATDIFAIGKTINICMLGVVTMEIMIVARYWTGWFAAACCISYSLVFPFTFVYPLVIQAFGSWDMAHSGVAVNVMTTRFFWISVVTVYAMTFSIRYFERSVKWLFRPDDSMIIAELEMIEDRAVARGSPRRRSYTSPPPSPPRSLLQTSTDEAAQVRAQRHRSHRPDLAVRRQPAIHDVMRARCRQLCDNCRAARPFTRTTCLTRGCLACTGTGRFRDGRGEDIGKTTRGAPFCVRLVYAHTQPARTSIRDRASRKGAFFELWCHLDVDTSSLNCVKRTKCMQDGFAHSNIAFEGPIRR
jgi:Phospholipid-translocating P-type ATPase C-terminal